MYWPRTVSSHEIGWHRHEDLGLLVLQVVGFGPDRRLHHQQRQHLQQMVLEEVADGADRVVERARVLRHRSFRLIVIWIWRT